MKTRKKAPRPAQDIFNNKDMCEQWRGYYSLGTFSCLFYDNFNSKERMNSIARSSPTSFYQASASRIGILFPWRLNAGRILIAARVARSLYYRQDRFGLDEGEAGRGGECRNGRVNVTHHYGGFIHIVSGREHWQSE